MDLRQLKNFLVVARLQHMTRASEELGLTQPALSRSIRDLERELDVELFSRVGRGIVLTSAGKLLVEHAHHIFRTVEQARDAVESDGVAPRGVVAVGAPPSLGNIFYSTLIERYLTLYPNVTVRVLTGMTHSLVEWLRNGTIDIGLVSMPPAFPQCLNLRGLECTPIMREDMYVFGSLSGVDFPDVMEMSELATYPLILKDPENMARQTVEVAARSQGLNLNVVVEVENQYVTRRLVDKGMGVGVVPGSALLDDANRFRVARLRGVTLDRLLVKLTGRPATPAQKELSRLSLELLDELKTQGVFNRRVLINSGASDHSPVTRQPAEFI